MTISHIPVVGTFTYRDADETPAAGEKIHFIAVSPATVDGDVVTLPKKLVCVLNADGEVPDDFTLPTVGDGLYYSVREKFPGGRDDYTILVLPTDTEINLATAAPVVPVDPLVSYATTAQLNAVAATIPELSDAAPAALGEAAAGTSEEVAHADHVHPMPDAADIPYIEGFSVGGALDYFGVFASGVVPHVASLSGGVAGQVPIKQSADDGDYAWGDIPSAPEQTVVVGTPASAAGVLTLNFAGKARAVFAVTLTENVTSVVHANVPAGVYLEKEVHYIQGGAGTYTVAQPASHHALGGSDTVVATTVGKVTVQSAASVDGGTTWRYAMQESA